MPSEERTLIILKPDAIQRRLVGRVLQRFEDKGLKLVALKLTRLDAKVLETHYGEHKQKPFYPSLLRFMSAGPVLLGVIGGNRAIEVVRTMMGKTFAHQAASGTIRGDLGVSSQFNLVHGSDSPESAKREIELFFKPDELHAYDMPDARWLTDE